MHPQPASHSQCYFPNSNDTGDNDDNLAHGPGCWNKTRALRSPLAERLGWNGRCLSCSRPGPRSQ